MTDLELKQWLAGAGEKSAKRWKGRRRWRRTVNEKEWLTYVRARLSEKEQRAIKEEEELNRELAEMGMTPREGKEFYKKLSALREAGKHKEADKLLTEQAIKVEAGIDMGEIEARLEQEEADKASASSHAATAFREMLEPGQWESIRGKLVAKRDKEDAASGKGSGERKGGRKTRRRRKTKRKRKSKKSRTRKHKKRRKLKKRKSRGRKSRRRK